MDQIDIPLYIITTAYNAKDYIWQYLSVLHKEIEHLDNVFVLIGIDNCNETLAEVEKIKNSNLYSPNITFYYSSKNVGTYVLKNSLLKEIPDCHDNILLHFFDIDDLFTPGYLESYYTRCVELLAEGNTEFFLRAMHLPIADNIINQAFITKSQFRLSLQSVQKIVNNGKFEEAVICLLYLCDKQYDELVNKNFSIQYDYRDIVFSFMQGLISRNMLSEIDKFVEALSYKYSSSSICNAISYIMRLYYLYNYDLNSILLKKMQPVESHGVFFTTYGCIKKLGFFNKYRISQDTDILCRATAMGIPLIVEEDLPFFVRRISDTSLTQAKDTDYSSKYRMLIRSDNLRLIAQNVLVANGSSQPLIRI